MSRFFFALWPDNSIRDAIIKNRQRLPLSSARLTSKENLHLTLLFLGRLTINQQQALIQQAELITCPHFWISLTHSGYFKNSKAAWLGLTSIPLELSTLHGQLLSAAEQCNIPVRHQNYTPHVTLARKANPVKQQQLLPIAWHIKKFALIESIDTAKGVQYHPIKYFTCI